MLPIISLMGPRTKNIFENSFYARFAYIFSEILIYDYKGEGFGSCSLSCLLASRFQPPILHDPRHSYLEARLVYGLV